jgi:hypothetical protein
MDGVHVTTMQNALSTFCNITAMTGNAVLMSMIKWQHYCWCQIKKKIRFFLQGPSLNISFFNHELLQKYNLLVCDTKYLVEKTCNQQYSMFLGFTTNTTGHYLTKTDRPLPRLIGTVFHYNKKTQSWYLSWWLRPPETASKQRTENFGDITMNIYRETHHNTDATEWLKIDTIQTGQRNRKRPIYFW